MIPFYNIIIFLVMKNCVKHEAIDPPEQMYKISVSVLYNIL